MGISYTVIDVIFIFLTSYSLIDFILVYIYCTLCNIYSISAFSHSLKYHGIIRIGIKAFLILDLFFCNEENLTHPM